MRWIAFVLAAALLLGAFGLWPFEAKEVESLLPVQTLCVAQSGADVEVMTDHGLYGRGRDYASAMTALEESAPGTAFFATCSAVVLCPAELLIGAVAADERLRPASVFYDCAVFPAPETVQDVLQAHAGSVTLSDVRAGTEELPKLEYRDGGWFVYALS